jgi:hypothetical protein
MAAQLLLLQQERQLMQESLMLVWQLLVLMRLLQLPIETKFLR